MVVLIHIVTGVNFPYNRFTMRCTSVQMLSRSVRWLGLGVLLAALPLSLPASIVTVDFGITLGAMTGTGNFTYDSTLALTDVYGSYVNASNTGLQAFNLTYNGHTYTMADSLDAPILPTVFLPGNTYPPSVPPGDFGFLAVWVVPGSVSGPYESLIGVGRGVPAFLLTNVVTSTVSFTGSGSSETFHVCTIVDSVKPCPDLGVTTGTVTSEAVTPEPALFPIIGLGIAGLWFARRKAIR
jgi:hypothetical protein